jgi:hypothetical protein
MPSKSNRVSQLEGEHAHASAKRVWEMTNHELLMIITGGVERKVSKEELQRIINGEDAPMIEDGER